MPKSNLKIIIPAAGYGTRMGNVSAKELLPHPSTGKPFILEAIERHLSLMAPFHIISRSDKTELNIYINGLKSKMKSSSIDLQLIEPSKEWPDTILKSKEYWAEWNLLLLPDTDYGPLLSKKQVDSLLSSKKSKVYFFTFEVDNGSTWGLIEVNSNSFSVAEKPLEISNNQRENGNQSSTAWGLILFNKDIGEQLFTSMFESTFDHMWKKIDYQAEKISLQFFSDLTRKG